MLRLLEQHSLTTRALLYPESMGLTLTERDSSATPTFSPDAPALAMNDWMQDMDEPGKGIVWRVKTVDGQHGVSTGCTLEHMIQSLGGTTLDKVETRDIAGGDTCTARQAAEYILAQQSDWVLGDFDYDGVSNPYHFNGETLKAALETVTGSLADAVWEYDFSVYPFRLHIRQQDQTAKSEMRAGRNLSAVKYSIDKTRMFTRFYPTGKNNLKPSPEYVSKNEGVYGRVDKRETDQSKTTVAELTAWANERLSRHAEPLVTVTVSGLDLSESTGESLDKLTVCRLCRVPLPKYGTTIQEKVVKLAWRDKVKDRESVTVTLANALNDVQSILKEEKAKSSSAARTAAALNEENEILIGNVESGLYTRITQTASELRREAHDEAQSMRTLISQTAASIRQAAEDDVNSLRTEVVQTAESIRQELTDEANSLRVTITETASSIQRELADEANSLRTIITETASGIRREMADEANSLRTIITETASGIRREMADEANSLRTIITETASGIRREMADEASSLRTTITETASSIQRELTDEANSLRTSITEQAGRVDLVVEGSGASAAIRLSAIVSGINQSQLELDADRVVIGSGSAKKTVQVYVDGRISATSAEITNLKTGVTKATLINSDAITADGISATQYMYTPSMSIGSGTQGGSGTLYFRGTQYYRQGLTLGGAGGSIAEAHFLGDSSTTVNIDHYHKITATEGTGADAGKIILTLSEPVATSDTTEHTANFSIAATTAYQNGVLAARNAVKVKPFTANAVTGSTPDHRTFTYITDAPVPASGTSQEDAWYLAQGSWSNNKTTVAMHYGSASGTVYAQLEVDAGSIYTAGGYAGRAAVTLNDPTADARTTLNETRTFTVSTSGRTNASGTADNLSKTVPLHLYAGSWSSNKATVYLKWGATAGSSGTNYAQIEVDASTLVTNATYAGKAAVTLTNPTWNAISGTLPTNRTVSISTSGRTNSSGTTSELTKSVSLYLVQGSWNGNQILVYLRYGSVSGTTYAQTEVDASTLVTNATYAGKAAVTLSSALTWGTTPSSGITANQNSVTVSTSGRTNTSGTADEKTKTVNLYSNASTSGLTATFYVTHTDSSAANRIIKRTATCSDNNLTAENIKKDVTIFGVTGTYSAGSPSVADDDIQIGSYNNVSSEPSGVTANTMKATILAAINNHNWFRFKVTVSGTSAVKYYKMKFD